MNKGLLLLEYRINSSNDTKFIIVISFKKDITNLLYRRKIIYIEKENVIDIIDNILNTIIVNNISSDIIIRDMNDQVVWEYYRDNDSEPVIY